jgi:ribosomal protein S18 acetylase RimI-like enzyme
MAALMDTFVEWLSKLRNNELEELCQATEEAIVDGNGFGWLRPPERSVLENYWRGVLLVPQRKLAVARLDGVIVGSVQFVAPPANNEACAFAAQITTFFVAPWARGHGLAQGLMTAIEERARDEGYAVLELDLRATQSAAIQLFEQGGFQRWATKKKYAYVDGDYVAGHYYVKELGKELGQKLGKKRGAAKAKSKAAAS